MNGTGAEKARFRRTRWKQLFFLSLAFFALSFSGLLAQQQERNLRVANKLYDEMSYHAAIHYYHKALKKEFHFEAMSKLAESYRLIKDYGNAEKWYGYVVNTRYVRPEDRLRYGQILMIQRHYDRAMDQFTRYLEVKPNDEHGKKFLRACKEVRRIRDNAVDYEIKNLSINSEMSDFCAVRFQDGIVFSSSRATGKVFDRKYNWDGNPFLDLYFAPRKSGEEWGNPRLFKAKFNSKFHEAVAVFDALHQMIFFTRNNFISGKKRTSKEGLVHLQIYYADLEKGGWTNLKPLPFNDDDYSVGHPSITEGGETLYFASDMPGGYGGTDIYVSHKKGDSWSQPLNLGPLVNTVADEMFPFIHKEGRLYFGSSGHGGLGGMDLYSVVQQENGWGDIRHLPPPINSSFDDFGLFMAEDGRSGFFSSDRTGGKGLDDIYSFELLGPSLGGLVIVEGSKTPISEAKVTLFETIDGKEDVVQSSPLGRFSYVLDNDRDYRIKVEKPGYKAGIVEFDTRKANRNQHIEQVIALKPPDLRLEGYVRDKITGEPIPGAELILLPVLDDTRSDLGGEFAFDLEENILYAVEASKPGYKPAKISFSTDEVPDSRVVRTILEMERDRSGLTLEGFILDPSGKRLAEAGIFLINLDKQEEVEGVSGPDGSFSFVVEPGNRYQIVARKFGYRTGQVSFSTPESSPDGIVRQDVVLRLPKVGQSIVLKNIYYDFDEWYIRQDAVKELEKLYQFLDDNPNLKVELSSHTDARGGDAYNKKLSQRRAEAAVRYLEYLGIPRGRLVPKGYGEEKHVNECKNGIRCSEAKHQENRRTEFTVIGYFRNGKDLESEAVIGSYHYGAGKGEQRPRPGGDAQTGKFPPKNMTGGNDRIEPVEVVKGDVPNVLDGNAICYSLQIGAFSSPNRIKEFQGKLGGIGGDMWLERAGRFYRYMFAKCVVRKDIEEMQGMAQKAGFRDAFIVSYQNGVRLKLR